MHEPDTEKPTVLVADNDASFAQAFAQMLQLRGYVTRIITDAGEVVDRVNSETYDLLTLDLDWGRDDLNGLDLLRSVLSVDPLLPIIVLTEHASIGSAVEATRGGAFDYLEKIGDREKTLLTVRNAIDSGRLRRENRTFLREIKNKYELVGCSAAMAEVKEQIRKVAPTSSAVLICGESGTGKELVARQIHYASTRRERNFVTFDAGKTTDELVDSELFGHCRGAFTGALQDRQGLISDAEGGTLFLDEISNASLELQKKLLRVLQEREYRRVGENPWRKCNIRLIVASNRNLPELVAQGNFREDLYYRLKVFEITVPPLRTRKDDIAPLVKHFTAMKSVHEFGRELQLPADAINLFLDGNWPGNVRELANTIEKIIVLSGGGQIGVADVSEALGAKPVQQENELTSLNDMTREFKRQCLIKAINLADGKVAKAADILQIDRTHLYKLLHEYHLKEFI